jgi:phosphoglycerol transferase MdoB-like AlkP superfamily enzyme
MKVFSKFIINNLTWDSSKTYSRPMKQILPALGKQFIFWLLFFAFERSLFLIFNSSMLTAESISLTEIPGAYWYSLRLDLAMACYILFIPYVFLLVQSIYSPKWLNIFNKVYTCIVLAAYSLLTTAELGIYSEWKTKLPYKALQYLKHPSELFNSTTTGNFLLLIFLLSGQIVLAFYLYREFFFSPVVRLKRNFIFTAAFLIISPGLFILGMRGGFQQIPINQSESYYSKHNILNHASVNSGFNFFISIKENLDNLDKNPFAVYPDSEAKEIIRKIYKVPVDTTIHILNTKRPNIVLIILESWSADLIQSLGGEPGITPQFRELEKGGILFTSAISSGARSEQGMASIFGGFPAFPFSSITVQPDKSQKLPSMVRILSKLGYSSSFYFGGQLIYGNIKGYIMANGFNKIREIYDFGDDVIRGKLGVHDEFVLSRQLAELHNEKQPFFSALFTLSSHSPYDQPMKEVLHWGKNERRYINAAYYTDKCLGEYFRTAKKESWYKNTLFILVADHGHNSYRNWDLNSPEYHRIPLLFYGDAIKPEFRGTQISRMVAHTDIPATILAQLGLDHSRFDWSRDLMNPYSPNFNYFTLDNGLGWIRPSGYFEYDYTTSTYPQNTIPPGEQDSIIKEGKTYLQRVFQEYMNY